MLHPNNTQGDLMQKVQVLKRMVDELPIDNRICQLLVNQMNTMALFAEELRKAANQLAISAKETLDREKG